MSRNTILVAAIVAALGLGAALWVTLSPEAPTGGSAGVAPTPAPAATSSSTSVPLGTAPVTPAPPQPAPAPTSLAVTPSPAPAATTMAAPAATSGSDGEETESATAATSQPAAGVDATAAEPAASAPTAVVPSFDIVRVERDGSTIVAGRAAPGSVVVLYDGETGIAEVTAGSDGSFVILLDQPLEPGSRRLSLGASEAGAPQVLSNDEVVVVVPEPAAVETAAAGAAAPAPSAPAPAPVAAATPGASPAPQTASDSASESASETTAEATSETGGEVASTTDSAAAGDAAAASEVGTTTEDATASEAAATEEAVASATKTAEAVPSAGVAAVPETAAATPAPAPAEPLVIVTSRDGSGPSVVLQGASGELAGDDLRIEAVDYDLEGEVIVSGRGPAGGTVVLYIDDKAVGQVAVAADGRWSITPEGNVATGLHRLRADLHDAAGTVSARVEIPFSRAAPIAVAASEKLIVVQPGHSLWVIAHGHYGEGMRYTAIYEANKGQIRDEDLIYPGQIFLVPSVN